MVNQKSGNLPVQLTSFIGRQGELAAVRERLADPSCRLLTLVGPGGIGKTRLAIEVVMSMQREFEDGVYFVPLQSITSPGALVPAIADALGLSLSGGTSREQQLGNYMRDKRLLLLLDNFEQLLWPAQRSQQRRAQSLNGSGAPFLGALLRSAAGIRLLVTSRRYD